MSAVISARIASWTLGRLGFGQGQPVELLQFPGDAPPLEEDHTTRHLGGVGGEDGNHLHPAQPFQGLGGIHARFAHALQRGAQGPGFLRLPVDPVCAASPFAVIGLGQVGQLEEGGEGLGDLVGLGVAHARDEGHRLPWQILLGRPFRLPPVFAVFLLTMADRQSSQLLLVIEYLAARLLLYHHPEQLSQGTHVAAQGQLLDLLVGTDQFGQPLGLVACLPVNLLFAHRLLSKMVVWHWLAPPGGGRGA